MKKYIVKKGTEAWALKNPSPLVSNDVQVPGRMVQPSPKGGFLTNKDVTYYEEDIEKNHEYLGDYVIFKLPENPIAPFFTVFRKDVIIEEE